MYYWLFVRETVGNGGFGGLEDSVLPVLLPSVLFMDCTITFFSLNNRGNYSI